ncbi:MAG: N-6 DNA methylase [Candidatus Hodarchaeales archaeon]|jgi:hypothetical protein
MKKKKKAISMSKELMSISDLRKKWSQEKSYYEVREVGTGVEIFVKDVLKSPDVFALKVGLNSTKLENRKHEYLEKKTSKGSRKPDITIYISPEIIIPVEVERYKNIDAGRSQLFKYQKDYDKKYGILTDGYTWQFYNNNDYRAFTLDKIFKQTEIFLEFWNEYIKEENYYLAFFEKRWTHSLLQETKQLPVDDYRQIFFEDITRLIKSFKNKLGIEGYLNGLPKKEREKTAVEITYAYIIQFILYKTLVDNEFDDFPREYEVLVEAIYSHLKENRFKDILGVMDGISAKISKNIYRPFSEEQEFIRRKLWEILHRPLGELHDVSPWLDIFVFVKKYNFADVRNEIFGYIYENYLKALYEDQKKGQYFTDPAIVNFMLEQIGYTKEKIKKKIVSNKKNISLIDPACGSGTFLYSAVDTLIRTIDTNSEHRVRKVEELVNKDIFGLDIAEFPLYLAEMNILMRMLPLIINERYNNPVEKKIKVFKTRDSIAEFMDTALRNTINNIDVVTERSKGQSYFPFEELDLDYTSYMRDKTDLKEMKESLENLPRCPRRRFDFVISNPPYVGYNESSKQRVLIFDLLKKREAKLSDIYGVNLHSTPKRTKKSPPKPNLYAFFIALGIALLKENGKICYIIPQTILTAGDLDVVRYHLAKFTTIEKIITFSGRMFIGRGLKQNRPVPTSSMIFVVRRTQPNERNYVDIVNCKDTGEEIETTIKNFRNRSCIKKKRIPQIKLLENLTSWNFINHNKSLLDFYEAYKLKKEGISIYYDHAVANYTFKNKFYFDIGYNIDERNILFKSKDKPKHFLYPKLNKKYYTIKDYKGFYPNIRDGSSKFRIKLLKNNQGYNLLDSEHKIIWSYMNFSKFHFTSIPIIWARNQICGIGSKNKNELLYLFGILNSSVINTILKLNLKSENEKDYLVSIASIKEFIKVPSIGKSNQFIKDEIINIAEEILSIENVRLSDLIDFSKIMTQKFDEIQFKGNSIILCTDKNERRLNIKSKKDIIKKTITDKYWSDKLQFAREKIRLAELKSLPAIDYDKQEILKDYIDDLVFALYFNVRLTKVGLKYADQTKKLCKKNKFYKVLNMLS